MFRQEKRHNGENCDIGGSQCRDADQRCDAKPLLPGGQSRYMGHNRDAGVGGMVVFWLTAGALFLGSALALIFGFRQGRRVEAPAVQDLQVYRDQLAEIERDMARGVIAAEEAARLRTEVSRRILEADRAMQVVTSGEARGPGGAFVVGAILAVMAGGVAVYAQLGVPGYPDMPLAQRHAMAEELHANRPGQAAAEAEAPETEQKEGVDPEFLQLMEKLRSAVAGRPADLEGQKLLAQNEARLGRFRAAHAAQAEVIRLRDDAATAADYASLGELLIFAAGGYVSPEAEAALVRALDLDPKNGTARYYAGLMFAQLARPDRAFTFWRGLLAESQPDDPWVAPIRAQIEEIASLAGEKYQLPPAGGLRGPDAAALDAAGEMSPEDRTAMIEGMVANLNNRLATEGGSAEEWAQLLRALGVLERRDQASAIWIEAQGRFASRPADLEIIRGAAQAAGVAGVTE